MSYQVLARKYRPQQFDEVIAQEHVTRTLKNAVKAGRLSSGYLFTGPRGTGKTTTARLLAKALNCTEGPTPAPCDKCSSCREIITGSSLDVQEIDAASNTGVDDIRTLRENVRYLPTSGKKRVYIIDEVHRLSGSAFDALLKTLEEPPPHVVFIFATTEPHKVPETIRSRTQRYDFHRVAVGDLSAHIKKIAETEKFDIDEDALFLIARKADGSVRDAISLLDQMSAFAGGKIDSQSVIDALGLIDRQLFFDYVKAVAARDCAAGLEQVKNLVDSGAEIQEFASGLAHHFRNLLVLKNAREPERLLEMPGSEMDAYKEQIDYFSNGDLLRMIKVVTSLTMDLKSGLEPRLLLETVTLNLACMEATVMFEDVLAHLTAGDEDAQDGLNEQHQTTDLFGMPTQSKASPPVIDTGIVSKASATSETAPESVSSPSQAVNLPIVQTKWPGFVEHLKRRSPMLSALLAMADIKEVKDNFISAAFPNANGTTRQVVEKPDYMALITAELRNFYKANLKIKFELDPHKKSPATAPAKPAPEKIDAEKILAEDEQLKNIVERFDGEIVGKKEIED